MKPNVAYLEYEKGGGCLIFEGVNKALIFRNGDVTWRNTLDFDEVLEQRESHPRKEHFHLVHIPLEALHKSIASVVLELVKEKT